MKRFATASQHRFEERLIVRLFAREDRACYTGRGHEAEAKPLKVKLGDYLSAEFAEANRAAVEGRA